MGCYIVRLKGIKVKQCHHDCIHATWLRAKQSSNFYTYNLINYTSDSIYSEAWLALGWNHFKEQVIYATTKIDFQIFLTFSCFLLPFKSEKREESITFYSILFHLFTCLLQLYQICSLFYLSPTTKNFLLWFYFIYINHAAVYPCFSECYMRFSLCYTFLLFTLFPLTLHQSTYPSQTECIKHLYLY